MGVLRNKQRRTREHIYLIILSILPYCTCSNFTGILRSPQANQAMFVTQCINGINSVAPIRTVYTTSLGKCVRECLHETSCRSVNFKDSTKDECELLASVFNKHTQTCTSKVGWSNYDALQQEISAIKDGTNQFCIVPETLSSELVDGTELILSSNTSHCNEIWAKFILKHESGNLIHFASNKRVCATSIAQNEVLFISSNCPGITLHARWTRTAVNSLSYGNYYCIGPLNSQMIDGQKIVLMPNACNQPDTKFTLYELDRANVLISIWNNVGGYHISAFTNRADYPDSPSQTNMYVDHMFSTPSILDYYGLSMKAYFIPPVSGTYDFYLACDNHCQLNFAEKGALTINTIVTIEVVTWTNMYQWTKSLVVLTLFIFLDMACCKIHTDNEDEENQDEARVKSILETENQLGISEGKFLKAAMKNKVMAQMMTYSKIVNDTEGGSRRVIMAGTKWCGQGNIAEHDEDFGSLEGLDRCCMKHDNCRLKIHKNKQRWGVKNTVGYTVMDCKCDDAFYACLKKDNGWTAWAVGNLFFNGLATPCVEIPKDVDINEKEVDIEKDDDEDDEDDDGNQNKPQALKAEKPKAKLRKAKSYDFWGKK